MKNKLKNKKGFSLIELSIVILIVGIVVAGVTQSSRLIGAFRLSTARNLTQSSPVASIKDIAVWFETTSENSFLAAEADNTNPITTWYDINPQTTIKKTIGQTGSARPTYTTSGINNLPALSFNGSSQYFQSAAYDVDLNPDSFTIFAVTKISGVATHGSIITSRAVNIGYMIYANPASQYEFDIGSGSDWTTITSSLTLNKAAVVTTLYDRVNTSMTIYKNSVSGGSSTATISKNTTYAARIGAGSTEGAAAFFLNGYIGELIIFSRALKTEERNAVENYLIKKWGIT